MYPTHSRRLCYEDCKKRTPFTCSNKGCTKMVCKVHSAAICESCIKNTPEKRTVTRNDANTTRRNCFLYKFCKCHIISRCAISECNQIACNNHRHRICYWCCSLNNIDAVFYRTYPLLYHKFGNMVIFYKLIFTLLPRKPTSSVNYLCFNFFIKKGRNQQSKFWWKKL